MRSVDIEYADCRKAQRLLDAYLSDEFTAETSAHISGHLGRCAGCQQELSVREQIKRRLQLTVSHSEVPDGLKRRISEMVRRAGVSESHAPLGDLE